MDLHGLMQRVFLSGRSYFYLIIDDFNGMTWVHILTHRSNVFVNFRDWMTMVELESCHMVKTICIDKGGEFTSLALMKLCADQGIRLEFANIETPWENGVEERKNCTVVEMARTMLEHRSLP